MWEQSLQTCRFCKESDYAGTDTMVKYGVRHYAHYRCYLDAGKKLEDLHAWQVDCFPYKLLKERGLLDQTVATPREQLRKSIAQKLRIKDNR